MNSKEIEVIVNRSLELAKKSIQDNMATSGRNASGKTSKSLRVVTSSDPNRITGTLYGSEVLEALEFGRGKSNTGTKGKRTWEKELRDWMRIRGIDQSAFYPIWRKINEEGYEGTKGLVTDPINVLTNNLAKELSIIIIKDIRKNGINSNK